MKRTVYGPVLSRRFGLSVGIDLLGQKVCTFDCVYCQVGRTRRCTLTRKDRVSNETVISDLRETLRASPRPDVITLAGSGEPTLHRSLGKLVAAIRNETDVPVALLTNGSLLWMEDVSADCLACDILVPSLDAGDAETFRKINGPHGDLAFPRVVSGLVDTSAVFWGKLFMEVMLVRGINDSERSVGSIARLIEDIRLTGLDINTVVRPAPGRNVEACGADSLEAARRIFREALDRTGRFDVLVCIIGRPKERASGPAVPDGGGGTDIRRRLIDLLSRRPCTRSEVCAALALDPERAGEHIGKLEADGVLTSRRAGGGERYFFVDPSSDDPTASG